MTRATVVTATMLAAAGIVAAVRLTQRPRAWAGLHLADGMLIVLGPDEAPMPALREHAGNVIRALRGRVRIAEEG